MVINNLSLSDSKFLSYVKGLSIFIIVFGHVGGFWVFKPYSEFLNVFVPIFFFISGAVSFFSYRRAQSIKKYYTKRLFGLLIPYYIVCIFSIIVFIIINKHLPDFNFSNFLEWIQIRPSNNLMPFPIGQVWFLHTLFFITIASPLFFYIQSKNEFMLYLLAGVIVIFSGVQLFYDIDGYFILFGNNLYKPIVHSAFYIFGVICFGSNTINRMNFMAIFFIFCIILATSVATFYDINIDYEFHTYAPDIYYVFGSFSAIAFFLILKNYFVIFVIQNKLLENILTFFDKHAFSIFLLHSFSIFLSENVFGLVHPPRKIIIYGLVKLFVVLTVTCIMSIPFTFLSVKAVSLLNEIVNFPKLVPSKSRDFLG